MLLVLDDLQWADRPTLLLLRHVARATAPARLLILGAYRSTERRSDTFTNALAELRRDRLASQLDIRGLSESDTASTPTSAYGWSGRSAISSGSACAGESTRSGV